MNNKELIACIPVMLIMAKRTLRKRKQVTFRQYWKGRKICGFTRRECEMLRRECNFTPDELAVFNLKTQNAMIVAIGRNASMSDRTVNRRVASVKRKIFNVMQK